MESSYDLIPAPAFTISQCVTLKLSDKNYLLWNLRFEKFLSSQKLLGFVNGSMPCPPSKILVQDGNNTVEQDIPEYGKWLVGSLSENTLKGIYGLNTSQEVRLSLAKKFNRVSASRKLDIQRKIQTNTKNQKSMAIYLAEIKSLCDQLDSIRSPISEHEKIYGVLNGLGKEYESICTVIEDSMDSNPICFEDVAFKLARFDDKLHAYASSPKITPHKLFMLTKAGITIIITEEVILVVEVQTEEVTEEEVCFLLMVVVFNNKSLVVAVQRCILVLHAKFVVNLVILLSNATSGLIKSIRILNSRVLLLQ